MTQDTRQHTEQRDFASPDEVRAFGHGRLELLRVGDPGQVTSLPAGHDAWVVGDEDVVVVDWWGASNYARLSGTRAQASIKRAGQYSIAVAAEACVALEIAEAAANSDRPIRIAKMIFRVIFMASLRRERVPLTTVARIGTDNHTLS